METLFGNIFVVGITADRSFWSTPGKNHQKQIQQTTKFKLRFNRYIGSRENMFEV